MIHDYLFIFFEDTPPPHGFCFLDLGDANRLNIRVHLAATDLNFQTIFTTKMLQTLKVLGVPFLVDQQQTFISLLRSVTTFPNAGGGSLHWPSILILKLFCSKLSIWILKFFPNVAIPRTLKFWASTSKELLANKAGDRWGGGNSMGQKFSVFWWSVSWGVPDFWMKILLLKRSGCFFHWKLRFGTWKIHLSEKEGPSYKPSFWGSIFGRSNSPRVFSGLLDDGRISGSSPWWLMNLVMLSGSGGFQHISEELNTMMQWCIFLWMCMYYISCGWFAT